MTRGTRRRLVAMVMVGHVMLTIAAFTNWLPVFDAMTTTTLVQMSLLSLWVAFGHFHPLLRWTALLAGGLCFIGLTFWVYSRLLPSAELD
jgi:hypothetical protein